MNPIPTKYSKELLKMPSSLLTASKTTRKPPRERLISNDQIDTFHEKDTITSLANFNEATTPDGFQFKKSNEHALFYNLVFDKETKVPKILESIKVDPDLHVQLQYNTVKSRMQALGLYYFKGTFCGVYIRGGLTTGGFCVSEKE